MILLKPIPQVHLIKENDEQHFFLHAVSYFPDSAIENDGYTALPSAPDAQGVFKVVLKTKTVDRVKLPYLTPVVHQIALGKLALDDATTIEVELLRDGQPVGKGVVADIDTKEKTKPGNQRVENWL